MCVNCVANSVPYVGLAAGGLKLMAWRARSARAALRAGGDHDEQAAQDSTPPATSRT